MTQTSKQTPILLLLALFASQSYGFTTSTHHSTSASSAFLTKTKAPMSLLPKQQQQHQHRQHSFAARMTKKDSQELDDEVERLRSMAAKLRAEAAALEAEQAKEMAAAAERAFLKFDTDRDGSISVEELKAGLEKAFKVDLSDKRVQKLMEDFDDSGDGALQLDEFVTLEKFRNKLDALARDERAMALEKAKQAAQEEKIAQALEAELEMINDKPPSGSDKILSVLPYLFPFLDGIQFAKFLILDNPENILAAVATLLYGLYRMVPFGGFIAFFALNILSGNPRINRQIRFNMQQAIFLDIALFFPGLLAALFSLVGSEGIPPSLSVLGSDAVFVGLMLVLTYCVTSSLLGTAPDKLPLISDAVNARMPSVDNIKVAFMNKDGEISEEKTIALNKKNDDDKKN